MPAAAILLGDDRELQTSSPGGAERCPRISGSTSENYIR